MARRQFKIPFAATGDTDSIPNETQPDGSVSMQQGFGYDYERDPQTDPLAKVFPRDVHNGILNEITASIGEIQQQGYPIWVPEGAPYPINAVVRHADNNWRSKIANNSDAPGVGPGATSWDDLTDAADERFNAPIATIASAATVNLTTGAPNTSQITITGSTTITGFTVAAGRAFVVKFTGSPILTNSASIVTGRGANIQVAPGDSCVIRATANNVVEVILYDEAVNSVNQTFTTSGNFTAPFAGTYYLSGCGGGGNGGVGGTSGGGGSGAQCMNYPVTLTAGQVVAVTVGGIGGTTSFGAILTMTGGADGTSSIGGEGGTVTVGAGVMAFNGQKGGYRSASGITGGGGASLYGLFGQKNNGSDSIPPTATGYGAGAAGKNAIGNQGIGTPGILMIRGNR